MSTELLNYLITNLLFHDLSTVRSKSWKHDAILNRLKELLCVSRVYVNLPELRNCEQSEKRAKGHFVIPKFSNFQESE